MAGSRRFYYWLVATLSSDVELVQNFTGFGLYDREVVELFRATGRAVPLHAGPGQRVRLRDRAEIPYVQPGRSTGVTKNNFFTLYDLAMLGITSHSKMPAAPRHDGGLRALGPVARRSRSSTWS